VQLEHRQVIHGGLDLYSDLGGSHQTIPVRALLDAEDGPQIRHAEPSARAVYQTL
jgi:hypothetical protein